MRGMLDQMAEEGGDVVGFVVARRYGEDASVCGRG